MKRNALTISFVLLVGLVSPKQALGQRLEKQIDKTEYTVTLGNTLNKRADASIVIGGKTEKFLPNIHASKWDDECFLNISHRDVVSVQKETLADGKVELQVGNNTHRYFVDDDGKLEYEVVFASRPTADTVTFDITCSDDLKFFYQDSLENQYKENSGGYESLIEYLKHHTQPENVVGSYAVYWNKKNNKYQTGKFCHIYRPKLIDNNGAEQWAELNITDNTMTISMDTDWLDNAVYPVRLDPTFGYQVQGGQLFGDTDRVLGGRYANATAGTTAQATVFWFVFVNGTGANRMRPAVYADSAGNPAAKLSSAEAEASETSVFFDWTSATVTPPAFAVTDYWLAVHLDEFEFASIAYDLSTAGYEDSHEDLEDYDNGLPDPFIPGVDRAFEFSIYIDFTEDTGAARGDIINVIWN